jgi:hypothetical protein
MTLLSLSVARTQLPASDRISLQPGDSNTFNILIDGQPFATWNYGQELPKPFLLPVRTASGVVINRPLNDASDPDHPHHKGLWFAVDEVNDVGFWEERGRIHNVSVTVGPATEDTVSWMAVNSWVHPESSAVQVTEHVTLTVHFSRLVIYDTRLEATSGDVTFGDTKEGMFGFRVAPSMKEKNGGHVVASDGTTGTANCWGRCYPWIDYSGSVDGKTVGVAIMDHPANFRPSRYHVRDYGLFSISPFGESAYTNGANPEAPVVLKQGESLRLRYAAYFHDGDATAAANVPAAYETFLKLARDPN